jgi:hypothetical protein
MGTPQKPRVRAKEKRRRRIKEAKLALKKAIAAASQPEAKQV